VRSASSASPSCRDPRISRCIVSPLVSTIAIGLVLAFSLGVLLELGAQRREPLVGLGEARSLGRRELEFSPNRTTIGLGICRRSCNCNRYRRPPRVRKAAYGRPADRRRLTGTSAESRRKPIFRLQQPATLGRERLCHRRRRGKSPRHEDRAELLARRLLLLEGARELLAPCSGRARRAGAQEALEAPVRLRCQLVLPRSTPFLAAVAAVPLKPSVRNGDKRVPQEGHARHRAEILGSSPRSRKAVGQAFAPDA